MAAAEDREVELKGCFDVCLIDAVSVSALFFGPPDSSRQLF